MTMACADAWARPTRRSWRISPRPPRPAGTSRPWLTSWPLRQRIDRATPKKGPPHPKVRRPGREPSLLRCLLLVLRRHVEVGQLLGEAEGRRAVADPLEI